MEVPYQVFLVDSDALPAIDDMVMSSGDPKELEQLYREAGFTGIADNIGPLQKADMIAQLGTELPESDYQLYAGYLSKIMRPDEPLIRPPVNVAAAAAAVKKKGWFDRTIVLSHPTTGESLLIGVIDIGSGRRYFKIAQWAGNTTIEELRKRQRFSRTLGRLLTQILSWRPRMNLNLPDIEVGDSAYFGFVTLMAAGLSWALLLLFDSWWVFGGILIVLMILCGMYVENRTRRNASARYVVGWLMAANLIGGLPAGLHVWQTADHTQDILVCDAYSIPQDDRYPDGPVDWRVKTSAGKMTLVAGFYDGTYYSEPNETGAKSLVGKWVRVTEHGHVNGRAPFITATTTLREGSCSK